MSTTYAQKQAPAQKKETPTASAVLDSSSQSEGLQRKADMANNAAQREEAPHPNNTGMPDNLKAGIESLSGFSMDDVRVHYNSSKPATVQALAYTQGTDIHVAPGQEKHLPHEAWHVAQQMAGRVSPTTNINGMPVNDNAALEHEADVMGEAAVQRKEKSERDYSIQHFREPKSIFAPLLQRRRYDIVHNHVLKPEISASSNLGNTVTNCLKSEKSKNMSGFWENLLKNDKTIDEETKEILSKITVENSAPGSNTICTISYGDSHETLYDFEDFANKIVDFLYPEKDAEAKKEPTSKIKSAIRTYISNDSTEHTENLPHLESTGAGERNRRNEFTKKIEESLSIKDCLLGGHLVKCAWGGEDDIMNVVAWDENKAEKIWSRKFENEIEQNFLFKNASEAIIKVKVTKENNWFNSEDSTEFKKDNIHLSKLKQNSINEGMENIPISVEGQAKVKTDEDKWSNINVTIEKAETGYETIPSNMDRTILKKWDKNSGEKYGESDMKKNIDICYRQTRFPPHMEGQYSYRSLKKKVTKFPNNDFWKNLGINTENIDKIEDDVLKMIDITKVKNYYDQNKETLDKAALDVIYYFVGKNFRTMRLEKKNEELKKQRLEAVYKECLNYGLDPKNVIKGNEDLFSEYKDEDYANFCNTRIQDTFKAFNNKWSHWKDNIISFNVFISSNPETYNNSCGELDKEYAKLTENVKNVTSKAVNEKVILYKEICNFAYKWKKFLKDEINEKKIIIDNKKKVNIPLTQDERKLEEILNNIF